MASACVNNIGMSPDTFPAPYGWLTPRVSFGPDDAAFQRQLPKPKVEEPGGAAKLPQPEAQQPESDPDPEPFGGDFEFCLEDPVAMLPADELFSDGKLVPLHVSVLKPAARAAASPEVSSPELAERRRRSDMSGMDLYLSSPKAPRCSSRWREILGLKKLYQNANAKAAEAVPVAAASRRNSSSSPSSNAKSFKHFLHRGSKAAPSSSDSSFLNMPLLGRDSDSDSIMISSRLSLSSSSSSGGHEHEDLPRLSLDSDKPHSISLHKNPNFTNAPRMRLVKPRVDNARQGADSLTASRVGRSPVRMLPAESGGGLTPRGVSVDSPRMNSSGKVIFQSLERSSSSPSTFNGGPRFKQRGMERSYSAGVRVTPVLNVPVSSLMGSSKSGSVFGFGPLFSSSPQKRDGSSGNGTGGGSTRSHSHHHHHHSSLHHNHPQQNGSRTNRTDRTT